MYTLYHIAYIIYLNMLAMAMTMAKLVAVLGVTPHGLAMAPGG